MPDPQSILSRLQLRATTWQNRRRIARLARQVASHAQPDPVQPPVVFFNASARLTGLSQNAAFSLLTSWGFRLAGVPIVHFVSRQGMNPCVLGTNREDYTVSPPCQTCITQSHRLYQEANVSWFDYEEDSRLSVSLQGLRVEELSAFEYPDPAALSGSPVIPLGRLVLPSIRWALRRHHLPDNGDDHPVSQDLANGQQSTRLLFKKYILSAFSVARAFNTLLDQVQPAAAVVFNGMMYPEATVRWVAQQRGLRVITHEVSFQRFSAFFTDGEATAYPVNIPDDFVLSPEQDARLDAYLEKRFQGNFTMAGIKFWPEMRGLDQAFLDKAARFSQIVPVFTNVIFDTSQVHANTLFPHMFAWLDLVLEVIKAHPETLFVIRAHPDEMRPGTAKQSRESVRDWFYNNKVDELPNVIFIDSQEYVSSYELIQRAKFVIVYNSSIGLEAALMGMPVLCGGKARYTQIPIVFFPSTPQEYQALAETFLTVEQIETPLVFQLNARRFLYYQLYCASLPFENYLETGLRPGFVQLKPFSWRQLLPEHSSTMQILLDGVLHGKPFLLKEV